jgi:hypothetical protein
MLTLAWENGLAARAHEWRALGRVAPELGLPPSWRLKNGPGAMNWAYASDTGRWLLARHHPFCRPNATAFVR